MKLNYKRTVLVGFAFFLISAFWIAYDAIVPLILTNHFGLPQTLSGGVMSLDNVLAVFMLPIFGGLSDKVFSRFGKRTPFIFIGTIAAVVLFIGLALVDYFQFKFVVDGVFGDVYNLAQAALDGANNFLKDPEANGAGDLYSKAYQALQSLKEAGYIGMNDEAAEIVLNSVASEEGADNLRLAANDIVLQIRNNVLDHTIRNIWPLLTFVGFIGVLLMTLISMATFRSPAVALMPDVTIKPLRSKGNAIINLMGAAGGILTLVLGMIFKTSSKMNMNYFWYVVAVGALMIVSLIIFIFTVKEVKWSKDMQDETARLGLDESDDTEKISGNRSLSKGELRSLLLILASVALWYIGYNSITSKYSLYATNVLQFDFNLTMIIAQAAAIVSYIPVGIISSKFGRKKMILAGVIILAVAFGAGTFVTSTSSEILMYLVFIFGGIGWATINVNSFPMVVELAKGGDVGKYTGYYYTASMAAQIVAPILSGIFYDTIGMRYTFFPFGTVFVALSFVTMFFVRHGDSRPDKQGVLESLAGSDD